LKPENVRWDNKRKNKFMEKLPEDILEYMKEEQKADWFDKIRRYRNMATHHLYTLTSSVKVGFLDKPLDYSTYHVSMQYLDNNGNLKEQAINVCIDHLKRMVRYISSVWEKMAQEFQ
jgi:hypothetical protein